MVEERERTNVQFARKNNTIGVCVCVGQVSRNKGAVQFMILYSYVIRKCIDKKRVLIEMGLA